MYPCLFTMCPAGETGGHRNDEERNKERKVGRASVEISDSPCFRWCLAALVFLTQAQPVEFTCFFHQNQTIMVPEEPLLGLLTCS